MDNSPPDNESQRRYDSEDYDTIGDPMSPSSKGKGGDNMASNITLWQFLLELLVNNNYKQIISFTTNDGEFKLVNAEEVAKLWGMRKNKTNMNYDKLSRALRYYYDKNIIKKVLGQKFVYRFVNFPEVLNSEGKLPFPVKVESLSATKISCGPVSPYSSPGIAHSPLSSSVPSPSTIGGHGGGGGGGGSVAHSPSHHQSPHHLTPPPPAHIGSYNNIGLAAQMYRYQAAVTHMAAAASLGNYLSAITRRTETDGHSQGSPSTPQPDWSPDLTNINRSPSPISEDSRDGPDAPLHLVSEETSRRRKEEEAEERKREEDIKKERSPLSSPMHCTPLTPPPAKDPLKTASPINKTVNRVRSGPKTKPSPLSIEAITGGPPVVSPRQFSASSLNTPVVSLPSPPYSSGVGTKSPGFLPPFHFWSALSPLTTLSPQHYGSPISQRHFTFPALPPHYAHLQQPILSPLIQTSSFDFSALTSPSSDKTIPVLQ